MKKLELLLLLLDVLVDLVLLSLLLVDPLLLGIGVVLKTLLVGY